MEIIILLALAVSGVSFTISVTSIFTWLRERVSKIHPKLEELIHCPWCLSHYIAIVFMILCDQAHFPVISTLTVINFILLWFAIITLSGLMHFVLLRTYAPIAMAMLKRKMKKE